MPGPGVVTTPNVSAKMLPKSRMSRGKAARSRRSDADCFLNTTTRLTELAGAAWEKLVDELLTA
jgi:hypothetical protein